MDEMPSAQASAPATRGELRSEIKIAKDELRGEIRAAKDELRGEIKATADRLDAKIDKGIHTLAVEIVKTQAGLVRLEERMDTLPTKDDFNRLLGAVESFAGKTQTYDRAVVLHGQALTELQVQCKDHEARIKTLEAGNS